MNPAPIYGMAARFGSVEDLVHAAKSLSKSGLKNYDTYSQFPIEELAELPDAPKTRIARWTLAGGIFGGVSGFYMQYYANVIGYPQNVAGRPLNSWPAFIPIAFALTILCAALATFVGVFVLNKLPQPYHPIFNLAEFSLGSADRFFICVPCPDPAQRSLIRTQLLNLKPESVHEIPA